MSVFRGGPNGGHFYSNLTQPVEVDCNFIVDSTNGTGLGVRSIKSNGWVRTVFMHTSATPGVVDGVTNPNPAVGYALIQFKQNFNKYVGGFSGLISATTGSSISISGSSVLTLGNPYVITAVGAVPDPKFTVTVVADVSGATAGKYFLASDAFSNNYLFYNVVSGVGLPPSLTGALANYVAIPVAYSTGASATTIGTALATAVAAVNNSNSFSAVNTAGAVLITSLASPNLVLSPGPSVGTSAWTVSAVTFTSLMADWQSVGVPLGLTPSVGMSFIATSGGSAKGTGTVMAPGTSAVTEVQVVGDPNQSIATSSIASYGGAWLLLQFNAPTSSSVTTPVATAPANNTTIGLTFKFDMSSVSIDGL